MRARAGVLLVCLAFGGCGGFGATTTSLLNQAQRTHEYPPSTAPIQRTPDGSASAIDAIRAFATSYINWNAQTVAQDMRSLARQSIGQARAAMQLAAANTAQDYELQRAGIANTGTVEAIAPLLRGRDRFVVVTLERTTAALTTAYQGLRPAWHIAVATVTQASPGRWLLSGWQPEN